MLRFIWSHSYFVTFFIPSSFIHYMSWKLQEHFKWIISYMYMRGQKKMTCCSIVSVWKGAKKVNEILNVSNHFPDTSLPITYYYIRTVFVFSKISIDSCGLGLQRRDTTWLLYLISYIHFPNDSCITSKLVPSYIW